ncbi:MAG: AmmeMemoRadiSam system protein A [Lachnospiraceae bacterium]|nr:AmmeMemoRadiSam system protein A [Lachnospiraceae bacterium]
MSIVGGIMVPHPPVILPEVGRGREREIAATSEAYEEAARFAASLKPETIVLSTPHSIMYKDYIHISPGKGAHGDMAHFMAPEVSFTVDYDEAFVEELSRAAALRGIPAGTFGERDSSLDHGTLIPLYYICKYITDFNLIRIGLSGESLAMHYQLGRLIQEISEKLNRRVVYVASGDLSHKLQKHGPYGFVPEGPVYDKRIMEAMGKADFKDLLAFPESLLDAAAECGHRSFCIMAGAFDGLALKTRCLHHEDKLGVGYGVCTYEVVGRDENRRFLKEKEMEKRNGEDEYIALARASMEAYIREGRVIDLPEGLPAELTDTRAGAFVSIHKNGALRGCIGTISPIQRNLGEEIIGNAISASTKDPRFLPITEAELPELEISVDVLFPAEPVSSEAELDVKKYGVIVTKGMKRGLLLPDLEGVDTVEEQVSIAKQKAGIDVFDTDVKLERFEVVRHEVK